jgi:hypothetical protein
MSIFRYLINIQARPEETAPFGPTAAMERCNAGRERHTSNMVCLP